MASKDQLYLKAGDLTMKNTLTIRGNRNNKLTILQLSDMHLHAEDSATLQGYRTNQKLNKLINYIDTNECIKPDIIFLTGVFHRTGQKHRMLYVQI
jgi:predicted MPP superfamily phosphohydrolase